MIIAITGTPGTGKTSLSKLLKAKGLIVLDDKFFYNKKFPFLVIEEDKELNTKIIDITKFSKIIKKMKKSNEGRIIFIDSHMSHLLPVDYIIVLERDLKELKEEFIKRGYNKRKIKDNLEAEAFKICRIESEESGKPYKVFNNYWKAYYFITKKLIKSLKNF